MNPLDQASTRLDVPKTLEIVTAALGPATAIREIKHDDRLAAAVARWDHRGAFVDLREANAIRVILNLTSGQQLEWRCNDRSTRGSVSAGSVSVVQPNSFSEVAIGGRAGTVQVILARDFLSASKAGGTQLDTEAERLRRLQALATQALVALSRGANGHDDLCAIAVTAAQIIAVRNVQSLPYNGGLAPAALKRVKECLDSRLGQEPYTTPALSELAAAAGLSRFHFIRAFRRSTGQTPQAWVTGRRINYALRALLEDAARVDKLADLTGFSSPSHFVSTFRQCVGVTPAKVREAVGFA